MYTYDNLLFLICERQTGWQEYNCNSVSVTYHNCNSYLGYICKTSCTNCCGCDFCSKYSMKEKMSNFFSLNKIILKYEKKLTVIRYLARNHTFKFQVEPVHASRNVSDFKELELLYYLSHFYVIFSKLPYTFHK